MGASGARMSRSGCRWLLGERSVGAAVVHVVGPGYLAYIPGGLYPAGLADLIAGVVDRYTGVRLAVPALVQLKSQRARLVARVDGLPPAWRRDHGRGCCKSC